MNVEMLINIKTQKLQVQLTDVTKMGGMDSGLRKNFSYKVLKQ